MKAASSITRWVSDLDLQASQVKNSILLPVISKPLECLVLVETKDRSQSGNWVMAKETISAKYSASLYVLETMRTFWFW